MPKDYLKANAIASEYSSKFISEYTYNNMKELKEIKEIKTTKRVRLSEDIADNEIKSTPPQKSKKKPNYLRMNKNVSQCLYKGN